MTEHIKHVVKEGARYHVIYWDINGSHCSHPNCEINKKHEKRSDLNDKIKMP